MQIENIVRILILRINTWDIVNYGELQQEVACKQKDTSQNFFIELVNWYRKLRGAD